MSDAVHLMVNAYRDFNETGMYMALYYVALLYLWLFDKEKEQRNILLYPALIMLSIVFNPIIIEHVWLQMFDKYTLPRIYFILPILATIAYVATTLVRGQTNTKKKLTLTFSLLLLFIFCGRYKITNEYRVQAENQYKIPQTVVEISDYIMAENETPLIIAPRSVFNYFRQYSSKINLLYGEDAENERIMMPDDLKKRVYKTLLLENPDFELVMEAAQKWNCDYIIFDTTINHMETRALKENNMEIMKEFDRYLVCKFVEF